MVRALRFAVMSVALLASSSSAQVRLLSLPIAPRGGVTIALTPFSSFVAPALALSPLSLTPSFSAAAPLASSFEQSRTFFDGAPAKPEPPAPATPASIPPRGVSVPFHDITLPTRMFSDETSISAHLIRAIDASRVSIDIAIHGLGLRELAAALVRAKSRGVRVRIVMNQTHIFPEKQRDTRTPEVQALLDQGFEMLMLRGGDLHGVMHNKIAIFDGQILETGSYNWTHAAETWHWENAMFHAEQARVAAFQAYWNWMWSVSSRIPKRAPAPPSVLPEGAVRPAIAPAPQDPSRPVFFNGESFPGQAFSPAGVTSHLVRAIDASRASIDVANFSFTSDDLRDALERAKIRGVRIRIVFDAFQYKFLPEMRWFADNGFDVLLSDGKKDKGVMHNKFAVFDGALVEAGSFNWTRNGEKNNYENAMFLDAPDDAAAFGAAFKRIRDQAWESGPDDHAGPHLAPEGFDPLAN